MEVSGQNGTSRTVPVSIPGTEINECPVSYITPQSFELVQIHQAGSMIKNLTGAIDFGGDSSAWDARHYDALYVIAIEDRRVEDEIEQARAMFR